MIPRMLRPEYRPAWQAELARGVKSTDELLKILQINPAQLEGPPVARGFPLRVPHSFINRMVTGDVHDPLLRQVLPVQDENRTPPGYVTDPLEETATMATPGLLHKYQGRVLLTVTGACAIHCRYCFRRHFPYVEANPVMDHWDKAIRYLRSNPDTRELILSGGDPLTLTDARLASLTDQLSTLPQLHTLRIHTRLPIVLPNRVDEGLLSWIGGQTLKVVMVVHCNHPNEIDTPVRQALERLTQAGVTLLNQSVLLRGINDDAATLVSLSERLFAAGVLPYYLHQLDKVQGAAHFEVETATARSIMAQVHASLPGYLVPRLVQEVPGMPGKTPL